MESLRIGVVPYLNMLPLLEGLGEDIPRKNWVRDTPRRLAEMLARGEIDVAAVSTYEGLRCADKYMLIPGAGIGSCGAVRSVALYSQVPLRRINTVLLDCASLTSINLAKILAAEYLDIQPHYELSREPLPPEYNWAAAGFDAVVTIGDTALRWENNYPHKLDLGEAWEAMTGLPFVFAAWWAREDAPLTEEVQRAFERAKNRGERNIHRIVKTVLEDYPDWPGGEHSLEDYFSNAIYYGLGLSQMEGLGYFRDRLLAHGLLPAGTPGFRVWEPQVK